MSEITPDQIINEVRRLAHKIEDKSDELPKLFQLTAEADVAYRVEYAKCLLRSQESTVGAKEADALARCEQLLWERKRTEAVSDAAREALRALRDQLSAVQSVGAMVRSEMSLAGAPGT